MAQEDPEKVWELRFGLSLDDVERLQADGMRRKRRDTVEQEARDGQAAKLRARGMTYDQIQLAMGYGSSEGARQAVLRVLRALRGPEPVGPAAPGQSPSGARRTARRKRAGFKR